MNSNKINLDFFPCRFSYYATGLSDMEKVNFFVATKNTGRVKNISKECKDPLLKSTKDENCVSGEESSLHVCRPIWP